jgi:hypothetical protein
MESLSSKSLKKRSILFALAILCSVAIMSSSQQAVAVADTTSLLWSVSSSERITRCSGAYFSAVCYKNKWTKKEYCNVEMVVDGEQAFQQFIYDSKLLTNPSNKKNGSSRLSVRKFQQTVKGDPMVKEGTFISRVDLNETPNLVYFLEFKEDIVEYSSYKTHVPTKELPDVIALSSSVENPKGKYTFSRCN